MLVVLGSVLAADETMKHYHNGKLPKYELSAPSIMLSAGDEEVLNNGKALMQVIVQADGKRRLLMVRDVAAPAWVVMDRILDFPAYPRMVKGCDALVPYRDTRERGLRVMDAMYEIHAGPMNFKYYMHHEVDEKQRCVTFHLDYDRQSDLDDSVGYWYVQPTGAEVCRVYYSCDTTLRGWVPAPVYTLLGKTALKQTTTWVNEEALKEWQKLSRKRGAGRLLAGLRGLGDSFGRLPSPTQLKPPRLPPLPKLPPLRLGQPKQDATSHVASVRSALARRASPPHRAATVRQV